MNNFMKFFDNTRPPEKGSAKDKLYNSLESKRKSLIEKKNNSAKNKVKK